MASFEEQILATIRNPDFICEGDAGELKAVSPVLPDGKVLVVVYREVSESDGFVITAHLGRTKTIESLRKRKIVWKQQN